MQYIKDQEEESRKQDEDDIAKRALEKQREENKMKVKEQIPILLEKILGGKTGQVDEITVDNKICFTASSNYDDYFHQNFGKKLVGKDAKICLLRNL